MDCQSTILLTFSIVSLLANKCYLQTLTLCGRPEKNTYCTLQCTTKDFNQPVTFAHPKTKDVGSCGSHNKCNSHYSYYTLSQSTLNGFITRFHIVKLDRKRDEGDWVCTYGNVASETMNLILHSRPNEIDISIRQSPESNKTYEINCTCGCLYPLNAVSLHLILTNQEKETEQELSNLKALDPSSSECTGDERTLYGSLNIDRDNWRGKSMDVVCLCKELKLRHTIKKKISYNFLGRPDEITITVNQSPNREKVYHIECTCGCIYQRHDVKMTIILSNEELESEQTVVTSKKLNRSTSRCSNEGRTVAGSMEINRERWQRNSLDIQCICTDMEIGFTTTKKMSYLFRGIPERPLNFQLISRASNYLEVKWGKGFDGGLKQTFIVQYMSKKGNLVSFATEDDGKLTEFNMKVTGLTPNAHYQLWLYAQNAKGRSLKIGLNGTTVEEIPVSVKVVIPFICFVGGLIGFTLSIYGCLFCACTRTRKNDSFITHEYKVVRSSLMNKSVILMFAIFIVFGLVFSYVAAFTLPSGSPISIYATHISVICLVMGLVQAVIYNGVLWTRFLIDLVRHWRYIKSKQSGDENMELISGCSLRNLIDNSTFLIKKRVNDGTFVKTKGYQDGWKKSLQYGAVIYIGAPGDGKTTHAYHIMNKWVTDYGHIPIILNDLRRLEDVISTNVSFVILIENIISNVIRNKMTDEEISVYFDMIMKYVKYGKTKIIMTEQGKTMYNHQLQFQHIDLFEKKFQVDLCHVKYKLTTKEREQILRNHCQLNNIEIELDEPVEKSKDNPPKRNSEKKSKAKGKNKRAQQGGNEEELESDQESLLCDEHVPVRISESTVNEIIKSELSLGYPENCASFCKNEKYRRHGLEYFLHPSEKRIEEIEHICFSTDEKHLLQYEVLRTIFMKNGKPQFLEKKYESVLRFLNGIYITQDEENEYIFINHSVYVAVGLVIGKRDIKPVIENCDWNFLLHYTKLDKSLEDKSVTFLNIKSNHYEIVKSKFLKDLPSGSVNQCFGYISKLGAVFLRETLDELQTYSELDKIARESCKKERGVFVYACLQEDVKLLKELWKRYENWIPKQILEDMINIVKTDSVTELLQQYINKISG